MKTALVYDWFVKEAGGGEKVFDEVAKLFPHTPFALFQTAPRGTAPIQTSFVQKMPRLQKYYRKYLPFYPLAIEQFDLSSYDLVLSISHCAAKGVLTHCDQMHLCYCFTPMRYAWDLYHDYLAREKLTSGWKGRIAQWMLHYLRIWDVQSSRRVDAFASISHYIARRIAKIYGRESTVIYPPVDTEYYTLEAKKEDFYVAASRLVPYKCMDVIVEAFGRMPDKKLIVIGEGPDKKKIEKKLKKNIEYLGFQPNEVLRSYLQKAKGFVFAALEDFGIVPVEAQSCGTPVIAYGKGGASETVVSGQTGVFFHEQTPTAICEAVAHFEQQSFEAEKIRLHAERFSKKRFCDEFRCWVEGKMVKR